MRKRVLYVKSANTFVQTGYCCIGNTFDKKKPERMLLA
jgi:hypothetical protein